MNSFINAETRLFGILGHPVKHSLSPLLHNASFRKIKFNGVYVAFDIEKPDAHTKRSFLETGIQGLSVTIPHKLWAHKIADEHDRLSQICRASNTLIRKENRLHAYNTDGPGALNALYTKTESLKNKTVMIIGYGGSAAAIAHAILLNDPPEKLIIAGRNEKKISEFIKTFKIHKDCPSEIKTGSPLLSPEDVDIIINTTPLGMLHQEKKLPLEESFIQKHHIVFDIVYIPHETPLITLAKKKKAKIVYGYLMLLHQAVLQFELFTGKKPPIKLMDQILKEALKIK